MKLNKIIIIAGLSLPIMADSIVVSAAPPNPNGSGGPCVVNVSDWPLGVLPDDSKAAFGSAAVAACEHAVGVGGAGAFIPPAHANGVFGAGGPLAGIGGAGAFIPAP